MKQYLGENGKWLIQGFEKLSLVAYKDGGGVWTIGYGHTGPDVNYDMICTIAQADKWFDQDTETAIAGINRLVKVPLTQNQFDALVSFVYNLGVGAFEKSTLLKVLNAGDYAGAADQLLRWDHDNGVQVPGLTRRRKAERELFLKPAPAATAPAPAPR